MGSTDQGPELIATCWLTAGDAAPMRGDQRSHEPFEDRVAAACDAGFVGFGILHADLMPLRDTIGYDGIRSILDSHGVRHLELEMLVDWFVDGERREESDRIRAFLLEAAAALGARHIKAGGEFSGTEWPLDRMVAEFHLLARQAADAGTRVALEPMPFSNIRTPAEGLRVVEGAGIAEGGLLLDVWHVGRLDIPMEQLGEIPAEAIVSAELDDADSEIVGTLFEDTINQRRFPGRGVLDVPGFIRALTANGYRGTWGVEIISEELRNKPMVPAVREAYVAAMDQFKLAGVRPF